MTRSTSAFDQFRSLIGEARPVNPRITPTADELKMMTEAQGLKSWIDGEAPKGAAAPQPVPVPDESYPERQQLWVVRQEDVVCAHEHCDFGKTLENGVIKHTNLTGGASAFSGGELVPLDGGTMMISGRSGRYGPRTSEELFAVARAFADSGYGVWLVGWDEDAKEPGPIMGSVPHWLS
jgi:hypothetical protein